MTSETRRKIEEIGVSFRFITPILIAIIGYFTIQTLNSIEKRFENVDAKFDHFLQSYHEMDKRVEKIEWKFRGR